MCDDFKGEELRVRTRRSDKKDGRRGYDAGVAYDVKVNNTEYNDVVRYGPMPLVGNLTRRDERERRVANV